MNEMNGGDFVGEEKESTNDSVIATQIKAMAKEVEELKDLFYRRLMNDKQKNELIGNLSDMASFAVIEPFLHDIFILIDRINAKEDEFSQSVIAELLEIINRRGVSQIDVPKEFNPSVHRVVQVEEKQECESLYIKEVVRNGYQFNDKVIRPADVIVVKPIAENNLEGSGI